MINNSQYMKIIQYLSILGGLEPPCPPGSYDNNMCILSIIHYYILFNLVYKVINVHFFSIAVNYYVTSVYLIL